MQQIMENLKSGFKITIITFAILFVFTNCSESTKRDVYFVLDMAGILIPSETRINLPLNMEQTEKVFSFQDYCKEEYDSIFVVYSYFNTEREDFLNLKMSNILRRKCDNNTMFDSFYTILFIKNGKVEAYGEIKCIDADFDSSEVEEHHIFPFYQKFIMDRKRIIHIYNG